MSRKGHALIARPARVMIGVALLAGSLSLVASSYAGIRDFAKSAKDKAAKAAGQKSDDPKQPTQNIEFDDTTLELTGDRLDRLIACRKAAQPVTKDRPALARRREAILDEIAKLNDAHGGAIGDNYNRRAEVANCMGMELEEIKNKKMQDEQTRLMANPAAAAKLAKLSAAMLDAQTKDDTAAVRRIAKQLDEMYGLNAADSLAAQKKCGPMPALHPAKVKLDGLEKELAAIEEKLRDIDMAGIQIQAQKCAMTELQIAMAWERIELYLGSVEHDATPRGFSATELQALSERRSALRAALAG